MPKRGMKKYLPFSSLTEQGVLIDKMLYEKNKTPKPQISIEQARKIDTVLRNYHDEELEIIFYLEGYQYKYFGKIDIIDIKSKCLYLSDYKIPLKNIINIETPNIFDEIC